MQAPPAQFATKKRSQSRLLEGTLFQKVALKSVEMKRSIEDEIFRKDNPTVAEYCEKWLKMRSASVRENSKRQN